MFDQISDVFYDEVNELLDNLEGNLLSLESDPTNSEIISAVFRAMHTIKGSAGMFGFDEISSFTHKLENIYDMVRSGVIPITPQLINLTLQARDHIRTLLGSEITAELQNASAFILEEFDHCVSQYKSDVETFFFKENTNEISSTLENSKEEILNTWRISFTPSPSILHNGTRPDLLLNELSEMGESTIVTFCDKIPPLSLIDETSCYFYWDIFLTTSKSENDINDVFIFVDDSSIVIEKIEEKDFNKKIGEILVSRNIVSEKALTQAINEQRRIGDILIQKNLASEQQIQSALAEQKHLSTIQKKDEPAVTTTIVNNSQSIRVNSLKLDQLIDLVGELVTFNARLSSISDEIRNSSLSSLSELAESLIFSLRDTSMDMRMVPIGSIFSKFKRLVHDISNDLNKKIELVTEGAETELDKNVIEKLNDPLIHLIRNSCDHGIESPEKRELLSKDPIGIVKLSATHAGSFVLISISDDGTGLNRDAILKKAIEKGIVSPKDELSDQQIYNLIFKSGFSTTEVVTSISGRGVGMDVVKRDIDSLGGSISIETEPGKGTSFILKIPLTLAIIDGMLVNIADNKYVIPVSNVVECIECNQIEESNFLCSHIILRDEYLPCINMRNYFNLEENHSKDQQIVIVKDQTSKIGIIVDHIIGNHQTVIKPIGKLFKKIQGISGSTILGDGSIAIILDIFKLSDIIRKMDKEK